MNTNMKSSDVATVAIAAVIVVGILLGGWLLMWFNKDRYQFVEGKGGSSQYAKGVVLALDRNTGEAVEVTVRNKDTGKETLFYWK